MERYVCQICGHKYDPDKGEPLQNIAPGVGFDALPPNWLCPVCSAEKTLFAKV
nr:rubredoxin [uncultured Methanoregula sp.]